MEASDQRVRFECRAPAATRHREEIDVYVNRAPLALDVADRRADSDREAPVLDGEIRAYLAERWSRSVPKEAARSTTWPWATGRTGGKRREDTRERRRAAGDPQHDVPDEAIAAANVQHLRRRELAHQLRQTL